MRAAGATNVLQSSSRSHNANERGAEEEEDVKSVPEPIAKLREMRQKEPILNRRLRPFHRYYICGCLCPSAFFSALRAPLIN